MLDVYVSAGPDGGFEHAGRLTQNPQYFHVVRGILDYLMRDMTHPDGGIFSAEVGVPGLLPPPPALSPACGLWTAIS